MRKIKLANYENTSHAVVHFNILNKVNWAFPEKFSMSPVEDSGITTGYGKVEGGNSIGSTQNNMEFHGG